MNCLYVRGLTILIIVVLTFLTINKAEATDLTTETNPDKEAATLIHFTQPFDIDSHRIVSTPLLTNFSQEVDSIMRVDTITKVFVEGVASIDGSIASNQGLAKARAEAMAKWLRNNTSIPGDIISLIARGEDWPMFRQLVEAETDIPGRQQVLDIIDSDKNITAKEKEIRAVLGGRTWTYLAKHIFPAMRCVEVTLDVKHRFIIPVPEEILEIDFSEETAIEEVETEETVTEEIPVSSEEEWRRHFYIKTDLPYWLMTWSNLAFEIDLAPHWSFNLPIYFSAVNYFKHSIKFRTFSFQPGVRYWLNNNNTGVYLEAHYGMGWWNFAFNGDYRYQDHFRKTPTMGGGLAAGYRLPISKSGRWTMEFGGGVGVYRLHYDRFQNRINGKFIDSKSKTVFFIDNINVSIGYSFHIERKKEVRNEL